MNDAIHPVMQDVLRTIAPKPPTQTLAEELAASKPYRCEVHQMRRLSGGGAKCLECGLTVTEEGF